MVSVLPVPAGPLGLTPIHNSNAIVMVRKHLSVSVGITSRVVFPIYSKERARIDIFKGFESRIESDSNVVASPSRNFQHYTLIFKVAILLYPVNPPPVKLAITFIIRKVHTNCC
jgi:hypothetical protein